MAIRPLLLTPKIRRCSHALICASIVIFARLFYLQIQCNSYFLERSTTNFLRTEKVKPQRGNILDCSGVLLATNRPIVRVYWQGTGNRILSPEQIDLCKTICSLFNLPYEVERKAILESERARSKKLIICDPSSAQMSQLEEYYGHNPNITLETTCKRYYPYGPIASHLIGYLGNITKEVQGIMGLEKIEQEYLRGSDGALLKTVNSSGFSLDQKKIAPELDGNNVHTTLDIELQKIAEQVFPAERSGTILIMNPIDGSVRVLVSRPGFDPNMFLDTISPHQWAALQYNQPFLNRATQGCYAMGSIFKLITISAALEHHLIQADSTWHCKGFLYYGKRKYWCNDHYGHGTLSTLDSIAQSCNIPFFNIGTKIDIDLLASYAHRFGIGSPTGILIPEKEGIVPSRSWKYKNRGEAWWQGETVSVTIGQSFLMVTPIQVLRMISAIFTGFLVRPRILISEPITTTPLLIAQETQDFLQASMKSVVQYGTGKQIGTIKDIDVYAKTSTAQVSDLSKRRQNSKHLEHGWCVCHATYKNYEPFTMVIVVENAGTSHIPTTIAKKFLIQYKNSMDARKDYTTTV
jgi:penicillin-binding protein 2